MENRKKKTIVTGGAGFIGSHLAEKLVKRGDEVFVIDNFSTGSLKNLVQIEKEIEIINMDIANPLIIDLVKGFKPDLVFHLAAQMDVRHSVGNPLDDAYTNIIGLLNVLEGACSETLKKIVIASSGGTIYGELDKTLIPVKETAVRKPLSPYGVAKVAGDLYLDAYRFLHGLSGTSLALGNVYGPRQDPLGEAGVISIFAGTLLEGKQAVIYGDGKQTRDFIYIDDVVEAFLSAEGYEGEELFNIGSGEETSINELHEMLASIIDPTAEPKWENNRKGELQYSALDSSLAQSKLDWEPVIDLQEGLNRTVNWFKTKE